MSDKAEQAPPRLWAEPFTIGPPSPALWVATAKRPDDDSQLVEYVRADLAHGDLASGERTTDEVNYYRLIYAVATKHPGEDRFETALRYIKNAEHGSCQSEVGQKTHSSGGRHDG